MIACRVCGAEKPPSEYRLHSDRKTRMRYCIACHLAKRRDSDARNLEKRRAYQRERYRANVNGARDKALARNAAAYQAEGSAKSRRKWDKENPDRAREMHRRKMEKRRETLSDGYVRRLLCQHSPHLTAADIPKALIDVKRAQLRIERALNENGS